jgi:hypothetical protein
MGKTVLIISALLLFLQFTPWAKSQTAPPGDPLSEFTAVASRPGEVPKALDIMAIADYMEQNPEFRLEAARTGKIRLFVPKGTQPDVLAAIEVRLKEIKSELGMGNRTDIIQGLLPWDKAQALLQTLRDNLSLSPQIEIQLIPMDFKLIMHEANLEAFANVNAAGGQAGSEPKLFSKVCSELGKQACLLKNGVKQYLETVYNYSKEAGVKLMGIPGFSTLTQTSGNLTKAVGDGLAWPVNNTALGKDIKDHAAYFGRSFVNSFQTPTREQVISGLAAKAFPFGMAVVQNIAAFSGAGVAPLASLPIGLSLVLDTYHGVFAASWTRFVDKINTRYKQAGLSVFFFAYGTIWDATFRTISYAAGVAKTGVFSYDWIAGKGLAMTGSITAAFAFPAMEEMAKLGMWSKANQIRFIQWREMPFLLAGTQLALGNFWAFLGFFSLERGFDLSVYTARHLIRPPTMLTFYPKEFEKSSDFKEAFPHFANQQPIPLPIRSLKEVTDPLAEGLKNSYQKFAMWTGQSCEKLVLMTQKIHRGIIREQGEQ